MFVNDVNVKNADMITADEILDMMAADDNVETGEWGVYAHFGEKKIMLKKFVDIVINKGLNEESASDQANKYKNNLQNEIQING